MKQRLSLTAGIRQRVIAYANQSTKHGIYWQAMNIQHLAMLKTLANYDEKECDQLKSYVVKYANASKVKGELYKLIYVTDQECFEFQKEN